MPSGYQCFPVPANKGRETQMQIEWFAIRWLMPCLITAGLIIGSAPAAWAIDISWRTTTSSTQGEHYTYEGTAVFAGEEAHIVGGGTRDGLSSRRTAAGETNYKFSDGSGFTIRWVSTRIGTTVRQAGIFINGTGRYAGMIGSAAAVQERPGTNVWTGSYELASE
jgi:hypothetical protein